MPGLGFRRSPSMGHAEQPNEGADRGQLYFLHISDLPSRAATHVSGRGPAALRPFPLQYVAGNDSMETTMHYLRCPRMRLRSCLSDWGQPGAAGDSCRMQEVGAKSGAAGYALKRRSV